MEDFYSHYKHIFKVFENMYVLWMGTGTHQHPDCAITTKNVQNVDAVVEGLQTYTYMALFSYPPLQQKHK